MPLAGSAEAKEKALEALGLPPGAAQEEVRRAFRRLAFDCHPDRHAGDPDMERRFKELSGAYRLLTGGAAREGGAKPAAPSGTAPKEEAAPPDPSQGLPVRGEDLYYRIVLDFMEAARGGRVKVRLSGAAPCPRCERGKAAAGCPVCGGSGEVERNEAVPIQVPPGVEDGETIRAPGEGGPGRNGGRAGDLLLIVSCRRHPALRREGLNVHSEVRVPAFRLQRGGPVRVFTVSGSARITIPPQTRSGRTFRLRGWGVQRVRPEGTARGDHLVRVMEMPASASDWAKIYEDARRRSNS
ncbi:MAG: DnaJ C-terminal domain-containing protein [bacterium]